MRRLFRNTCLGLLVSLVFCMVAILTVFAVLFQQSQAVTSNTAGTVEAIATPMPPMPLPEIPLYDPLSEGEVIIQIDTPALLPDATSLNAPPTVPVSTFSPISTAAVTLAPDLPRHSGTSSYPVTLTVEAMLALTHVAGYQAGVAATRTAIAAESARIFATLTAVAPVPTVSAP